MQVDIQRKFNYYILRTIRIVLSISRLEHDRLLCSSVASFSVQPSVCACFVSLSKHHMIQRSADDVVCISSATPPVVKLNRVSHGWMGCRGVIVWSVSYFFMGLPVAFHPTSFGPPSPKEGSSCVLTILCLTAGPTSTSMQNTWRDTTVFENIICLLPAWVHVLQIARSGGVMRQAESCVGCRTAVALLTEPNQPQRVWHRRSKREKARSLCGSPLFCLIRDGL